MEKKGQGSGKDGGVKGKTRPASTRKKPAPADDLFHAIFNFNPAATAVSSISEGVIIKVNRAFLDLTGYTEEEVVSRSTLGLNIWVEPKEREAIVRLVMEKGSIYNVEARVQNKSGEIRYCLFSGNIIQTNGERCLLTMAVDITDRKMAYEEIRRSREAYRESVDNSPAGIFKVSYPGGLTFVNAAMAESFGYETPGEMMERVTDIERHIYFNREEGMSTLRLLRDFGEFRNMEYKCRKRDGTPFWVMASCRAKFGDSGTIRTVDGYFTDITKRKEAEETLARELVVNRAHGSVYEKIIGASLSMDDLDDMVMVIAAELTESVLVLVSEIDPATGGVSSRPHATGTDDPAAAGAALEGFLGILAGGDEGGMTGDAMVENDVPQPGPVPGAGITMRRFLAVPAIMRDEILGLVVMANSPRPYTPSDVEAMKRLAAMYAMAIDRIRSETQINLSLREKEILLKEIHHRVKNNMQIISSLLGLQATHVKDDRDAALFKVSQNRVRSMALVHEKLYQSDTLAGLDFSDYITDLVRELSQSYYIEDRIDIVVNANRVFVNIDNAIPCALIIYELVSNALTHAFPGERVGKIEVNFSEGDDEFRLRVCDNGVGLPPETEINASDSLGLQLVDALVQQLQGTMRLDRGGGTAYTITFRGQE